MDVRAISPELLTTTFPKGMDLLLDSPPMLAHHLPRSHRVHTPMGPDVVRQILHLIMHFFEAQPEGVGYIWNSSDIHPPSANPLSLLGLFTLLDASKCDSGAYRNTRIWQNLMHHDTLAAEHARLLTPTRQVDAALVTTGLSIWSSHLPHQPGYPHRAHPTPFREPHSYLSTHSDTGP